MADDQATRMRRYRAHQANDHRLCHPRRCSDARVDVRPDAPPSGSVSDALAADLAELPASVRHERRVLIPMAELLAAEIDAGNRTPFVWTEFRGIWNDLIAPPGQVLVEERAKRHQRRIDTFLPLNQGLS